MRLMLYYPMARKGAGSGGTPDMADTQENETNQAIIISATGGYHVSPGISPGIWAPVRRFLDVVHYGIYANMPKCKGTVGNMRE